MSAPVTADDLVQGAVKWLLGFTDIAAVLGVYPDTGTPWLFQTTLWATVEGSQSTAAVISRAGGWAGANAHNTMRFPRIRLELYADPIRDGARNLTDPGEAWRRIEAAWDVFDSRLHRPAAADVRWGDVRTLGCLRLGEPTVYSVPDGEGMLRLQCFYGVAVG